MNVAVIWSGKLDAVAGDAGESDGQMVALRADGADLDGFGWRLWFGDDGLGGEIEGNAEDIGVLDVEEAFRIQFVRLASEGAADDLFAEELGAEGSYA